MGWVGRDLKDQVIPAQCGIPVMFPGRDLPASGAGGFVRKSWIQFYVECPTWQLMCAHLEGLFSGTAKQIGFGSRPDKEIPEVSGRFWHGGTAELCLQMGAEGTSSAVQLLHKVLCHFSVSPSLSVCAELRDLSDLMWKLGVVPFLSSRKYLKVPLGSVHCSWALLCPLVLGSFSVRFCLEEIKLFCPTLLYRFFAPKHFSARYLW